MQIIKPAKGGYLLIFGTLLILGFFLFCFRTIEAGQVGVVTRFGDINREVEPGIALKLPWPIERLKKLDVQVQKEEVEATAATRDLQDANAVLALNYHLERGQVVNVYQRIGTDYKNRVILPAVQEAFKASTTDYTAAELLTKRAAVKEAAVKRLKERLNPQGIIVDDLSIVNFSFSQGFTQAIEEKQVAQQQAERAKFIAERAKQEAQAEIERAKGQSEAQRLLRETANEQTIELRQLEVQLAAIKKWNGAMPTYWMGEGNILSIPLQGR